MTIKWKQNEELIFKKIKEQYESSSISFKSSGGADSTNPDIEVFKNGKNIFNIEVKANLSQSGQFVVLENNGVFEFSKKNKSCNNEYSQHIITYMNSNYSSYSNPTTASTPLNIDNKILSNWIINYYKQVKNSLFFATIFNNNLLIFPTEYLPNYFNITACYRVKKSGSRNLPKSRIVDATQALNNHFKSLGTIEVINNKAYYTNINAKINTKQSIPGSDCDYYIASKSDSNKYEIKVLSNTNNANVIFQLSLNTTCPNVKNYDFEETLKNH